MRYLSRAALVGTLLVCGLYLFTYWPIVSNDATHLGAGYFWAWLLVTMPITLRYWIFPLTFGRWAFKAIYAFIFDLNMFEYLTNVKARRITAVLLMMLGFFVTAQLSLHFIIEPFMTTFLDYAAQGAFVEAGLLAVWLYVLHFLIFTFVFPLPMGLIMPIVKTLTPKASILIAYEYRGYLRGAYPFMNWVLQPGPYQDPEAEQ